jgi:uncharacterized protein
MRMWRYEVAADRAGHPRWWLYASNGRMVAYSGEAFDSTANARRAALNFKAHAAQWGYEVYPDAGGAFRWRATSANGQTVASSGESFDSRANALRAAENVRLNGGSAAGP